MKMLNQIKDILERGQGKSGRNKDLRFDANEGAKSYMTIVES